MQFIRSFGRISATTAGTAVAVLALAGCGGSAGGGSAGEGPAEGDPITLTVATFNDFGYTQDLFDKYTEEHPNITVEPITAAGADDARTNLTTKLAAGGEGLADIEAIEVDWISELAQYPDLFT
ncbi:extracellular solute-binding protein, partial [Myceligenerans sp. TRM 65318]|nr:extracellular solute-binding protein [Myceligenerans sp. TRM 65318]MBE3017079.1 extracellular solute-binding protein [Myceligenerans sp. TRM 65318]